MGFKEDEAYSEDQGKLILSSSVIKKKQTNPCK